MNRPTGIHILISALCPWSRQPPLRLTCSISDRSILLEVALPFKHGLDCKLNLGENVSIFSLLFSPVFKCLLGSEPTPISTNTNLMARANGTKCHHMLKKDDFNPESFS